MHLSKDERDALGVALNEATLLGLELDPTRRVAAATFSVLSLPEGDGPPPSDSRVQFIFERVGRVLAALREGHWNHALARVVPFAVADLLTVVQSFGGLPIYGWDRRTNTTWQLTDTS